MRCELVHLSTFDGQSLGSMMSTNICRRSFSMRFFLAMHIAPRPHSPLFPILLVLVGTRNYKAIAQARSCHRTREAGCTSRNLVRRWQFCGEDFSWPGSIHTCPARPPARDVARICRKQFQCTSDCWGIAAWSGFHAHARLPPPCREFATVCCAKPKASRNSSIGQAVAIALRVRMSRSTALR